MAEHLRTRRVIALLTALAVAVLSLVVLPRPVHAQSMNWQHLNKIQKRLASGALEAALAPAANPNPCINPTDGGEEGDEADDECAPDNYLSPSEVSGAPAGAYYPVGADECVQRRGDNVKVNQNCQNLSDPDLAGRGQAQSETSIAIDRLHPRHVLASQNDYRRGDSNCYAAYSLNGGRTWNDTTIPMSFTRGEAFGGAARQYWQAGGDTSVAWDTKGNAYLSCQVFNRGAGVSPNADQSSAFYVFRSTQNFGASWNFPGRPVTEFNDTAGSGAVLEDKQLMTVDNHVGSPFQDRIYVTWTEFAADGTAYIWSAYSADYGESFSDRHLVSGDSALCTNTFGLPTPEGSCNENQFSQPFTGPDGALYVVWANFNNTVTGSDNRNQMLIAKSTDGGETFGAPQKVGDYYDLPDCLTYQNSDPGRACVPEKGPSNNSVFRATNYPVGAVDPRRPDQVIVTYGSYINRHSNESNGCTPTGFAPSGQDVYGDGPKTPGACNNDILISVSHDGGATFTGTTVDPRHLRTVTPTRRQALSDQWWQWVTFTRNGELAVSYYDRMYGRLVGGTSSTPAVPRDEYRGWSDVSLSGGGMRGPFRVVRVTSSSMPPPTQFGGQFYGDYMGLDAYDRAMPVWMDTRDPELFPCVNANGDPVSPPQVCLGTYDTPTGPLLANDQNIYTAKVGVPRG